MCGKGSQGGGGVGALGWGGLAPAQQQTIQASPEAMGWYRQAMQLGQQAASRPYQQFGTRPEEFVAQLTPGQQQAIGGLGGLAQATQPYAAMAPQMAAQAGMANAAQMAGGYMNPYMEQVVSPVRQALEQQQGQQLAQQQAEAIRGGAFGGERAGLQRQLLRGQQQLGMGQALSPLYQTGYGQALGAAQTDLARQLQAAQGLQGAGIGAQQAALGASTLQQQTAQAGIDALRQQFQQQQMFPYMQAQFLGGLAGGLGPLLGQQTYQARAMTPFGGFFEEGGAVDGDAARMGGAVVDLEPGRDYYEGGVAPAAYARGGVSYAPGDVGDILKSQAEMYGKQPELEQMPTGQIQAAKGLEAPNLAVPEQQKKGLSDITGAAKDILGIGKDIYGMISGKSDDSAHSEGDSGSSLLKGLGKMGLSAAANYVLPGSGFLAGLFAEGGRVGYADRGAVEDDTFGRGIIGAESARRQFDRQGRVLTSPKGALGIAQIMPTTAPEAARLAGLEYSPERLRSDPEYNEALGRAYYNEQLRRFGTPQLAAAAYNAGPGRVQQALRRAQETGRDVMSFLPQETRDYVPRVMRLAGQPMDGSGIEGARQALAESRRAIPAGDPRRRFMALDDSAKMGAPATEAAKEEGGLGGLLTEQNVVPALMGIGKGLSAMMGAKTVSPGAAFATGLGEGLAGGAESYLGTQKALAEIPKTEAEAEERRQLARRAAAETATEMARTGQVEATTKQIGAGTEKVYAEIAGNSVIDIAGVPHMKFIDPKTGTYRIMSLGEWNSLDPSERPSIDPRIVQITKDVQAGKGAGAPPPGAPATGAPGAGAALEPPKVETPSTLSVPQQVGNYAQKVAVSKANLSRDTRNKIPDLFSPQIELARSAEEQKQNLIPLVGAIAALPAEKSILTSGKQQEILNPLVNYLAGIARTFGQEEAVLSRLGANPSLLADTEEVKKLVNQMQQTATQNNQLHAFGAFKELAEGIPSLLNSPGAQRRLAAQLLASNQRQIDKNNIFADWRRQAAGPRGANAEFAQFTSPEANKFFDDTYSNAFYAPDRENISKLFEVSVPVKGGGSKSMAEILSKYPNKLTPEAKEYLNKSFPGVLRYFGIR